MANEYGDMPAVANPFAPEAESAAISTPSSTSRI
jgi:hypothetical protein